MKKILLFSAGLLLLPLLTIHVAAQLSPSTATFPGNITVNSAVVLNQSTTAQAVINNVSAVDGNNYLTVGTSTGNSPGAVIGLLIYTIGSTAAAPLVNAQVPALTLLGCDPTIDSHCVATFSGGGTFLGTDFASGGTGFGINIFPRSSERMTIMSVNMFDFENDSWSPMAISTYGVFTVGLVSMGAAPDPDGSWQYGGDAFSEAYNDDFQNGSLTGLWDWGSAGSTSLHGAPADWWFLSDMLGDIPVLVAPYAPTNSLLISSNGYVGIGTADPASLFQVGGGTLAVDVAGHMLTGGPLPVVSTCGGGSPQATTGSNMIAGKITTGTGTFTSCTVTWPAPFPGHVSCQCSDETSVLAYTPICLGSGTSLFISGGTNAINSGDVFSYSCKGF